MVVGIVEGGEVGEDAADKDDAEDREVVGSEEAAECANIAENEEELEEAPWVQPTPSLGSLDHNRWCEAACIEKGDLESPARE